MRLSMTGSADTAINIEQDLDFTDLNKLAGDDLDFKNEIIALIISHTQNDIQELKRDLELKSWGGIKFTVHRMRSSLSPLALSKTMECLKQIERKIQGSNYSSIARRIKDVIGICEQ